MDADRALPLAPNQASAPSGVIATSFVSTGLPGVDESATFPVTTGASFASEMTLIPSCVNAQAFDAAAERDRHRRYPTFSSVDASAPGARCSTVQVS